MWPTRWMVSLKVKFSFSFCYYVSVIYIKKNPRDIQNLSNTNIGLFLHMDRLTLLLVQRMQGIKRKPLTSLIHSSEWHINLDSTHITYMMCSSSMDVQFKAWLVIWDETPIWSLMRKAFSNSMWDWYPPSIMNLGSYRFIVKILVYTSQH